ncbi:7600_t:CDS:2 [Ambispora leptoticha]|uniref:Queuine tRNA-ribosyltransferase accessory subunit 2 n=1 Tax=Ambispora leptoticha TaxID=144679 RepID=A0A9N9CBZ3_9GLOM|nr:7600_t:CDS:2 [Ambispora leptoticha]
MSAHYVNEWCADHWKFFTVPDKQWHVLKVYRKVNRSNYVNCATHKQKSDFPLHNLSLMIECKPALTCYIPMMTADLEILGYFSIIKSSLGLFDPTESSIRLGKLTFREKTIRTPNCILYTIKGSVPHLTPDNLRLLPFGAVQVTLEHFVDVQPPPSTQFPDGIHKFLNLEDFLVFYDIRDPGKIQISSFNTEHYVAVRTHQGVRKVTPKNYIDYTNIYKPDIVTSMADILYSKKPGQNRVSKSVTRTLQWLDELLNNKKLTADRRIQEGIHVFGVLVGDQYHEERKRCAKETVKRDVSGFVLQGLALGTTLEERIDLFKISLDCLPEDKPRFAYGLGTPDGIFAGIAAGIDLFDTSYPTKMAESGHALTFSLKIFNNQNGIEASKSSTISHSINLFDSQFKKDFRPFVPTCTCIACLNHSRAYVHHLVKAREMLGSILLISHNLLQYAQFFQDIRESIKNGTFEKDVKRFKDVFGVIEELDPDTLASSSPSKEENSL